MTATNGDDPEQGVARLRAKEKPLKHQALVEKHLDEIEDAQERGFTIKEIHETLGWSMSRTTFQMCLQRARYKRRVEAQAGARERVPPTRAPQRSALMGEEPVPEPVRSQAPVEAAPRAAASTATRRQPGTFEPVADSPDEEL